MIQDPTPELLPAEAPDEQPSGNVTFLPEDIEQMDDDLVELRRTFERMSQSYVGFKAYFDALGDLSTPQNERRGQPRLPIVDTIVDGATIPVSLADVIALLPDQGASLLNTLCTYHYMRYKQEVMEAANKLVSLSRKLK